MTFAAISAIRSVFDGLRSTNAAFRKKKKNEKSITVSFCDKTLIIQFVDDNVLKTNCVDGYLRFSEYTTHYRISTKNRNYILFLINNCNFLNKSYYFENVNDVVVLRSYL